MGRKFTYEYVKNHIESKGYQLLSDSYINGGVKLRMKCPAGHIFKMGFASSGFHGGTRCPRCMIKHYSDKQRHSIEYVIEFVKKFNYECVSKVYKDAHSKLNFKCDEGHEFEMRWDCIQQGQRCPVCSGNKKKTIKEIRINAEDRGYKLISNEYYPGCRMTFICPSGHEFSTTWDSFRIIKSCPKCAAIQQSIVKLGSGNPMWKGGMESDPYCEIWSDKEFKEFIKFRDGYQCLNPYCYSKPNRVLVVHHIDYNKQNCDQYNLITVCNICNSMANKDRGWHKLWYQTIINKRYKDG
ncbi:hypothetical protein KAR91_82205 [Candidatus Pacearchaeota archaeon]|nr:hypothetical protein [Candidatus Pacearchaeota archaeon]